MFFNRFIVTIIMVMSSFVGAADQPLLAAVQPHPRLIRDHFGGHQEGPHNPKPLVKLDLSSWTEINSPGGPVDFSYLDTDHEHSIYIVVLDKISGEIISLVMIGSSKSVKLSGFYRLEYLKTENKNIPAGVVPYLSKGCFVGDPEYNLFNLPPRCSNVTVTTIK